MTPARTTEGRRFADEGGAMTPLERLQGARNYLMEHGWWGGGRAGAKEEACALLALYYLDNDREEAVRVGRYLAQALGDEDEDIGCVISWNDKRGRSFNEVMSLFDDGILLAKEAEANVS